MKKCIVGLLLALLMMGGKAWAQGEEPSPIEIELVAPNEASPGSEIEVLIRYDVVDLNAGADINYNVFGPCRILKRDPEPPNPVYNTWLPGRDNARGTIRIRIQVNADSIGETLRHQVEVRWGPKVRKFETTTVIKNIPPTPTPTFTPRPRPQPKPTPTRQQLPTPTPRPGISLREVAFISPKADGRPLTTAEAGDEIVLRATYASTGELKDVRVVVRFEPDVVNLDGIRRMDGRYVLQLASLPAAPEGGPIFSPPIKGRIRPYSGGGERYELRAFLSLELPAGAVTDTSGEVVSKPLVVTQQMLMSVRADLDARVVRSGGSLIVHAICENLGTTVLSGIALRVAGLPTELTVTPQQQTIGQLAKGENQERVFTVDIPKGWEGVFTLRVAAIVGEKAIESEPVSVEVVSAAPLVLKLTVDKTTVSAGESLYAEVVIANEGRFPVQGVTAKLVDTTGNLGVLFQEIGDLEPGDSRKAVFVVAVPPDLPADTSVSLVAQAIAADGEISQSSPVVVALSCVPSLEITLVPPRGKTEGGKSVGVLVVLRNPAHCPARDVTVSLTGLPAGFAVPPPQKIAELTGGGERSLTFNLLVPEGYQGEVTLSAEATDNASRQVTAPPVSFTVGGVPVAAAAVFGLLLLLALAAIIIGVVLYFRHR